MKQIKLLLFLALFVIGIFFMACTPIPPSNVTNFDECVSEGYPVLETYPAQCRVGTSLFTEDVHKQIGGETDTYGCLSGAGYSWDENIGVCLRAWEMNEEQLEGAILALSSFKEEMTLVNVKVNDCESCYEVQLQRNSDRTIFRTMIINGEIQWVANSIGEDKTKNLQNSCESNGGTWLPDYDECEYISKEACEELGGIFNECESACRHDSKAVVCTQQCVLVCTFSLN